MNRILVLLEQCGLDGPARCGHTGRRALPGIAEGPHIVEGVPAQAEQFFG